MKHKSTSDKKVIQSFLLVGFLLTLLGIFSIIKIIELSDITARFYQHPLTVTNATQSIQTDLTSMHRYMKDVVLAKDNLELQTALKKVNTYERNVYENFEVVFTYYLGDKQEVSTSYELFKNWKHIRDKVVALMHEGKKDEAIAITKEKGAEHVFLLNKSIETLVIFAHNKAELFVQDANNTKHTSIIITIITVLILLILIASIMLMLLRSLKNAESTRIEHEHQMVMQSRLAQMGEMISMIAHQWRQPLGAIAAVSIDMKMKLELETFDLSTAQGQKDIQDFFNERVDDIAEFTKNLTRTINDFRDFYKQNKELKSVTMSEPLNKALNIIRASLKTNNIELKEEYRSMKTLAVYESELMQVLLNIFKNAQDAFEGEQIKNAQLLISTQDVDDGILIKICDNAGGIEQHILDKIFNPYFSTKEAKNGTGLGLYMSKIIIEEHHNGELRVSNVNEGSCFEILLRDHDVND